MSKVGSTTWLLLTVLLVGSWCHATRANDLRVTHVALTQEMSGSHVGVQFEVRWENSWRNDLPGAGQAAPFNHDAAWVFVKYSTDGGRQWAHATLSALSADHNVSHDNGVAAIIQAVPDCKGVFLYRAHNGTGAIQWQGVQLRWNYAADGLSGLTSSTIVNVHAVEMVHIPAGDFQLGDNSSAPVQGQFEDGTSSNAFTVTSEDELTLGGGAAGSLGNNNAAGMAHADDFNDGTSQTLAASFPKGHGAFFVMKYEITQGQYADFLNLLSTAAAANRTPVAAPDYPAFRGTISGSPPRLETAAPERACNFLSWMDGAAYADWAGLRPISELEYEKMARGNTAPVPGEYAWGSTNIVKQTAHAGQDGSGSETAVPSGANANYDGGINGPVRAGIYAATSPGDRTIAGASYYGVMELSGNLWERVVSVGHPTGRQFAGTHGDGLLTATPGAEGNATNHDWPGLDANAAHGITGAAGSGFRGGGWMEAAAMLRISDRSCASTPDDRRVKNYGFRGVRTAP